MHKIFVKLFYAFILFLSNNNFAQVINIGSGTNVNGTTTSSPVNIWYRRCVSQTVYTVAELNAAGISGAQTIRQLGYYVTQSPLYDIPGYTISMKHTTANNASGNLEGGYTVVKNAFNYNPEAGGYDYISLDNPFNWNGTQNIVVRICWTQVQPTYNASGQCRIYNAANGYKYRWDDNAGGACGLVPNTTVNTKPQVSFIFDTITVWTGASNTNWNVAANWTKGVPNKFMDARIPTGTTNDPNVNTSAVCEELILEGDLNLAANGDITIHSHFTNTGNLADNGGDIIMSGRTASHISGTMTIQNLIIENEVSCSVAGGQITIGKELQVNQSVFNTANSVVLKSDANGTARIAELKNKLTYTLNMFDSYGDGWNGGYLTVLENGVSIGTYFAEGFGSVQTFNVLSGSSLSVTYTSGSWENENSFNLVGPSGSTIYTDNAPINSGTVYSATASGPWTDVIVGNVSMERYIDAGETYWRNFSSAVENATISMYLDDFVTAGFPGSPWPSFPFNSIYTYDETLGAGDGWVGCTGTSQVIQTGQGLYVWSGDTITGTDPFTLDLSGQPNQGPINMPVTFTNTGTLEEDGWCLVGNPYASTIDWDSPNWVKTNIADAIYIMDPDNQQFATYVSGASVNGGSNLIASQQAFWVYASAASPALTLNENCKSNVDQAFFKNATYSPGMTLRLSGNGNSDESVLRHIDGALDENEYSYDAVERWGGWGEVAQLSLVNQTQTDFAIHSFDMTGNEWSVPVRAVVFSSGDYDLTFENVAEINAPCLKLEDTYTGLFHDITEGVSYTFALSDTTWYPRFMLHVGKTYPVEMTSPLCFGDATGQYEIDLDIDSNIVYTLSDGTNSNSFSGNGNPLQINNLIDGNYLIEIPSLTNLCDQQQFSFEINQPEIISAVASVNDELNGMDGSINLTISGGTQPFSFNWNNGSISEDLSNLTEGIYQVQVIDFNGCQFSEDIFVGSSLGVFEKNESAVITYSPVSKQIYIQNSDAEFLVLYDLNGNQVGVFKTSSFGSIQLPSDLSEGVYLITDPTSDLKLKFIY